ncbi:MAG TPA: hypothetical protein VM425_17000 [Myxococcota bacterium]|nr:hypothetical protein [Myxococcota bacterium]
MKSRALIVLFVFVAGCSGGGSGGVDGDGDDGVWDAGPDGDPSPDGLADLDGDAEQDGDEIVTDDGGDAGDAGDQGPVCPVDPCIVIGAFPYQHSSDTLTAPLDRFDSYACAPNIGEAGPEEVFMFSVETAGTLVAMLDDGGDVGADVDIHLLAAVDPDACLQRANIGLSRHLLPGTYFLTADSYSDSGGTEYAGPYTLYAHFLPDGGNCSMLADPIQRIGASEPLEMPATGQVVKEAHLVTDQEFSGGTWPQSFTDGIQTHYQLSESETGYGMDRTEPWCPCCEPSNEYGQGSGARPPVEAEAFYINMRWASAPPRGQRYIVFNGKNGKAVVAAAGYENGPGDLTHIGGACEEIHDHLGTEHLSVFIFGVAADQNLSYGPIDCEE